MAMTVFRFVVLVVAAVLDNALCQAWSQTIPFAGIGFVRPLHSSSTVSSSIPPHSALNESESGIGRRTASNSSSSSAEDIDISGGNSSSSSGAEILDSADTNSSYASSSAVNALEPVPKNSSTVVGDPGSSNSSAPTNTSALEEDLIEALEEDQQVTVLGEVLLGELLCESLVEAEDAPLLQVAVNANEEVPITRDVENVNTSTLLVNKTSYSAVVGQLFTGGVGRRTWTGVVIDPEPAEDEAFAREVSMTWGEVCDVETFSLVITKHYINGNTSVVKSVPCGLSGLEICIVEVALDFLPYSEPLTVGFNITEEGSSGSARRRRLDWSGDGRGRRRPLFAGGLLEAFARHPTGWRRRLQSEDVEIQAIVFYSDQALELVGVSDTQMESRVSAAFADVDVALANSEIGITLTIVYQGSLPYEEGSSSTGTKLEYMRENPEVMGLRNQYGADVVMLVGELNDVCGLAYFLPNAQPGYSEYAYSAVHPNCFANKVVAHELGHNLGCEHNREHSTTTMEYAHGYRYCSGITYTTIMSYTQDCTATRVNYFANPDVSYLDQPTGSETENCARAIQENREVVSNFREQTYNGDNDNDEPEDDDFDLWEQGKHFLYFLPIGIAFFLLKRHCLRRSGTNP